MPIQDPHATLKRQSGGPTVYTPRSFDEPQPTAPARKPPVLQQHDRKDFPSNSQYQKAAKAASEQYERENAAYATEKSQYDRDIEGWRARKAVWDTSENEKVKGSGAGQQRLQDYLKTPEGQKQQDFNAQMLAAPFIPAGLVATQFGKGMKSPYHKVGYGLAEIGAGEALRELEKQQQPDKYDDPAGYYKNQAWQNFLVSTGMGAGTGSLRSAFMKDKNAPVGATPPTTPEPTPPQAPPVEHYKGTTKDVARVVAHDLGLGADLPSGESKVDTVNRALAAIKSGTVTPEQIATVTQKAKGLHPEKFLTDRLLNSTRRLPGIAGAIGLGAAAAAGMPGEAEASPAERAPRSPKPETSSDLSDLEREYGTGLPKGATREALKGAADTAISAAPVVGEARMAAEAPNLYKPSDEDLADAEYWQHGREEMAKQRAQKAPTAPTAPEGFSKGGSVDFNPEHLPEHERGLIDSPHEAIERASWQLPYLAAGRHMVKLTGDPDTFFGGRTPEHAQHYDDVLKASKAFYDNAFKRLRGGGLQDGGRVDADQVYARNKAYAAPHTLTQLNPADERNFQEWVTANKVPFDPSPKADYDMRGFYNGLMTGDPHAKKSVNANDNKMHYDDWWKTPYHESFSAASQWAKPGAPNWINGHQLALPNGQVVFDERAQQPPPEGGFKHGGKVSAQSKKIVRISDKFRSDLKNKERLASSLERAYKRTPTHALHRKLKETHKSIEQIKNHLTTLRKHEKVYA